MYYLLEDNKIYKESDWFEVKNGIMREKRYMGINLGFAWHKIEMEIIKQSENVFDLIRTGDLVQFKNKSILKVYTPPYCSDFNVIAYDVCLDVYVDEILAIYKPNKNGDYIKVWEKE